MSPTSLTPSIEKLDGSMATGQSNYNAWRFRIIRILKEKDLVGAIEDSTVSTTKDDQAFTIITLNIKDSQIPYIQDATNTKAAWAAVKEVHQGIGMNRKMVLMQRLWALKMTEGADMANHLNQFRELSNQLRSLSQDGRGMDNSELVTIRTLSLPESYEPLVMALQSRSDIVTFDTMAGRLLQESGRRHISQVTQSGQEKGNSPQTAFTVHRAAIVPRGMGGRGGYQGRGRRGYRPRIRESFGSGMGGQEQGRNTTGSPGTKCQYCGKIGHWKKECYKKKADEVSAHTGARTKEFTFLAEEPSYPRQNGWIIESGASQHSSQERERFLNYTPVSNKESITIADATKLHAHGRGNIQIATEGGTISLTDVWHVRNIGASLLSVVRMVDAGYGVEFNNTSCFVSKMGKMTELGHRHGNLYYLNHESERTHSRRSSQNQANLGLATNQSSTATLGIWQRRLGHRTLDESTVGYISTKVTDLNVSGTPTGTAKICGICAVGRQQKEPQTKTREKPRELLSIVHTDICGPMQTPSINGERYFVTFTDEKSGRVSICLLRTKDGTLAAFQSYRARAERVSGKRIKSLRSDGGGEYLNREFKKYLAEAGIQHRISPPYSPAQNGLAERMN